MDSPPAADELFPEDEFSDAFSRFGLTTLRRLPRPRPAAVAAAVGAGGFVLTFGADRDAETGAGTGDFTGDGNTGVDVLGLAGSGLVCVLVLGITAGEPSGVLVTAGSLLEMGLGGSMLSFGT